MDALHQDAKLQEASGIHKNDTEGHPGMSPFGHLFRFLGWWFGIAGLYSVFSVCPFCGQSGCPVGLASAGTIGAFLALCMQDWKKLFNYLREKLTHRSR